MNSDWDVASSKMLDPRLIELPLLSLEADVNEIVVDIPAKVTSAEFARVTRTSRPAGSKDACENTIDPRLIELPLLSLDAEVNETVVGIPVKVTSFESMRVKRATLESH